MEMTYLLKNYLLFHKEDTGKLEYRILFKAYYVSYVKNFWK